MSAARDAYATAGELDAAQSDRVVAGPVGNRGGRVCPTHQVVWRSCERSDLAETNRAYERCYRGKYSRREGVVASTMG